MRERFTAGVRGLVALLSRRIEAGLKPRQREDKALWRLSVKSTAPHADLEGEQLIEWGGALRWLVTAKDADRAPIRVWAKSSGGHATLFRGGNRSGVFTPLDATIATLHKRLKATFDPHGIVNRGRLYADF